MKASDEKLRIHRIPDDEPIFILRGQDVLATRVVERWIELAEETGVRSAKVAEARRFLKDMERWPTRRLPD